MAFGSAFAHMPGRTSHGMQIPPGYASVSVEQICLPKFEDLELEIPGGDGEKTLKDALHGIILWPKRYIIIPENEPSIPPRDPPRPPPPSSPGPSSPPTRSPSPQLPFNSGGASDDDDLPSPKQAPKSSRSESSKAIPPPKLNKPAKNVKKAQPVKRKLPYEMTTEENEAECQRQVHDWLDKTRDAFRQRQREEKEKVDPAKLSFFKKMKEETKKQVLLKTDYDRSLTKSLEKKRRGGSPNSYIEEIAASTSSKVPSKKKKQIDASTSSTYVASGLNAQERALANMPTEEIVKVINFAEETGMTVGAILGTEDPPPPDKNFVPRWPFVLGQHLVRPELVKKLPTKMHRFHQWYMKHSVKGLEMFGMVVRPEDMVGEAEKVIWLTFKDIYEVYHLDSLNTDLIIAWCL